MKIQELTKQEYEQFISQRYYVPFQSAGMYERLALGGHAPKIYGGYINDELKIAMMGGFYPYKKIFKYFYSPYGYVTDTPTDIDLVQDFVSSLAKTFKLSNIIAIKMDPSIELFKMDPFGNKVEGGYDNSNFRTQLEDKGFIVPPLTYEMSTLVNPRQVAIVDLAELSDFPGHITPDTKLVRMHDQAEQLEKMKPRTQRYIRTAMKDYIKVEEGDIAKLEEMGEKSGDAKHFEFAPIEVLRQLKDGFGDACRIRHCYIDLPEYRQAMQDEIAHIEAELKALEGKKVNKQKKRLEADLEEANKKLHVFDDKTEDKLSLACGMFLTSPKETFFLFSGIDRNYRKYQGATRLNWDMITWSLDNNVWRYNLLGIAGTYKPDDPNEGLIAYKRDLGARIAEYIGTVYYPVSKTPAKMMIKEMEA